MGSLPRTLGIVEGHLDVRRHEFSLRFDDTDLARPLGFASYGTVGGLRQIAWRRTG